MTTEQAVVGAVVASHAGLEPQWAEVVSVEQEITEVATFGLRFKDPAAQSAYSFKPGQFNMLYLPGYGEAAISISSDTANRDSIAHTVRFVGSVTRAVSRLRPGDQVGVQGTIWQLLADGGARRQGPLHCLWRHRASAIATGDLPHPQKSGSLREGDAPLRRPHTG